MKRLMESVLLNCLPRPRIGVLHFPQVIRRFDNTSDLIEMSLKKDNCLSSLYADGIVSLDLDFKMQFGNRLFPKKNSSNYLNVSS